MVRAQRQGRTGRARRDSRRGWASADAGSQVRGRSRRVRWGCSPGKDKIKAKKVAEQERRPGRV